MQKMKSKESKYITKENQQTMKEQEKKGQRKTAKTVTKQVTK